MFYPERNRRGQRFKALMSRTLRWYFTIYTLQRGTTNNYKLMPCDEKCLTWKKKQNLWCLKFTLIQGKLFLVECMYLWDL